MRTLFGYAIAMDVFSMDFSTLSDLMSRKVISKFTRTIIVNSRKPNK
jgi:hypothetical protein